LQTIFANNHYTSADRKISFFKRHLPSLFFYLKLFSIVWRAGQLAKNGKYTDGKWISTSKEILLLLESVGVKLEIKNLHILKNLTKPVVFIGNHMSTLETFILPYIIQSVTNVTFVVKKELISYPVFGHVMKNRNPIVVNRVNPRDDFKVVLEEGKERLARGISVIIFPQTTRTNAFDPKEFNSIGVKLAKNANAPIIPMALKTDAWGTGKIIKDFGKINPAKKVTIVFGNEIIVDDNGKEAQAKIIEFIAKNLAAAS